MKELGHDTRRCRRRLRGASALMVALIACLPCLAVVAQDAEPDLLERLQGLPGAVAKEIEPTRPFQRAFEIWLPQPLDHLDPGGARIFQRIFLSHLDPGRPMVLETEGYAATWPKTRELARLLGANQLIVEHRYFGVSGPDSMDWKFLTIEQAAADHHRVVELFKGMYPGRWVSTGRSKGGMAALFHRSFHPDDVDATVAFVAPIMLGLEDNRFEAHMDSRGTEICRARIAEFQRAALERREEILPVFEIRSENRGWTFAYGVEAALEWAVIDFPYAFWQGHADSCDEIPTKDASPLEMLDFLDRISSMSSLTDAARERDAPLVYQAVTELGYHGYATSHIRDLLRAVPEPAYSFFGPRNVPLEFEPRAMSQVLDALQNGGRNIIYLYGEHDPWTACAVEPGDRTNALKFVLAGAAHRFGIDDFPEHEREAILSALERWLAIRTLR